VDVVQSASQKPIGVINCHKATLADKTIGGLVASGGIVHISAPTCCPKCKTDRGSAADIGLEGVIIATRPFHEYHFLS